MKDDIERINLWHYLGILIGMLSNEVWLQKSKQGKATDK